MVTWVSFSVFSRWSIFLFPDRAVPLFSDLAPFVKFCCIILFRVIVEEQNIVHLRAESAGSSGSCLRSDRGVSE